MLIHAINKSGLPLISSNYVDPPSECPVCHRAIEPKAMTGYFTGEPSSPRRVEAIFICPRTQCERAFIVCYEPSGGNVPVNVPTPFSWELKSIAPAMSFHGHSKRPLRKSLPNFAKIYNEALHAEQLKLVHICGPGFRKSLEFLVKDYAKSKTDSPGAIEKKSLAACITDDILDPRIQSVAKRATWLGNDETHYVRKWETKDLQDLKKLIDLTVHWIVGEVLTRQLEESMPADKK